jgi:hypothetical protein
MCVFEISEPEPDLAKKGLPMQTSMPSDEELAHFIKSVLLAIQNEGIDVIKRVSKEEPLWLEVAVAKINSIMEGPEKKRQSFIDGAKKILGINA